MPTRISAGVDDHPCFLTFITMIPTDCKINFSLNLYSLMLGNLKEVCTGWIKRAGITCTKSFFLIQSSNKKQSNYKRQCGTELLNYGIISVKGKTDQGDHRHLQTF